MISNKDIYLYSCHLFLCSSCCAIFFDLPSVAAELIDDNQAAKHTKGLNSYTRQYDRKTEWHSSAEVCSCTFAAATQMKKGPG